MQQALVYHDYRSDMYTEFFTPSCFGFDYVSYSSTEELLSSTGWSLDLINLLHDKGCVEWAIVLGDFNDVVFFGRDIEGGVIAYGLAGTMVDWLSNLEADWLDASRVNQRESMTFGRVMDSPSLKDIMSHIYAWGFIPEQSYDAKLTSVISEHGSEYWMMPAAV